MPNGKPIGQRGNSPRVRIEKGGDRDAKKLFYKLSKKGKIDTPLGYPGIRKRLPNGDWVGRRPVSKHGEPAIDVRVKGFPYDKIKFPE